MPPVRHLRFVAFLVLLAAGAAALWGPLGAERGFLAAFILSAAAFAVSTVPLWRDDRAERFRDREIRDDGGRALQITTAAAVLAVVLIAVGRIVTSGAAISRPDLLLVLAALLAAWVFIHLVYAFHYAHLFYAPHRKGDPAALDFPGADRPVFADFCYFSFIIGMTCQTSDVNIRSVTMRRTATVHGVIAFLYNLGVLALTINVIAGSA